MSKEQPYPPVSDELIAYLRKSYAPYIPSPMGMTGGEYGMTCAFKAGQRAVVDQLVFFNEKNKSTTNVL